MNAYSRGAAFRPMPSDRANLSQQWRIFTCTAKLSGTARETVTSAQVARDAVVGPETVAEVLRFLEAVDLVQGARGQYKVSPAGLAVAQRWEQDETQARLLLQALFLPHWWVTAVVQTLQEAPVDQDVLGRRLHEGLAGKPRRGAYLVDWLVLALLVCRDENRKITLSPALRVLASGSPADAVPESSPQPSRPEQPGEPDALMHMTNTELRALPAAQYCAVLDQITELVRVGPA